MSDLLKAPRAELLKLIYDLVDENQSLKAQIAELKAKLSEKSPPGEKSSLPSFVKPNRNKKKKTVRKNRNQGFARMKDTPTQQIFHAYDVCPDCGGTLGKPAISHTRQIIDVELKPVTITEHVICKRFCFSCRKRVAPRVSFAHLAPGKQRIGINLVSLITTMRERVRLPVRVIKLYLKTFHQLELSEGEIIELLHTTAGYGKPTYETIKQTVLSGASVCADETGGREDGINGYLWNFTTSTHQYLLYRKSRGSKVVTEFMGEEGENFNGVLVTDFYAAYNVHSGFHQRCWTHLLRDIHELTENIPKNRRLKKWANKVHTLYRQATGWTGPDLKLPLGIQAKMRIEREQYFRQKLKTICDPWLLTSEPMSPLCGRIIKFLPELFTFIRFPNVPSTNNLAERTLRHSVVQRKIFGGTRSRKGSETKTILGSLFGTWNLQGLNPFIQCKQLLLSSAPCQRV